MGLYYCLLGKQHPVGRYPRKICCWWLWKLPWWPCTVSKVPVVSCVALRGCAIICIYLVSSFFYESIRCVDDALQLKVLINLQSNYDIQQCDKLWKHCIKYSCDVIWKQSPPIHSKGITLVFLDISIYHAVIMCVHVRCFHKHKWGMCYSALYIN